MQPTRIFLIALLAVWTPTSSFAADSGEFPGVYVREFGGAVMTAPLLERLQLKCLLAPDVMNADGQGAGYFLDTALFNTTGQISYIKGESYKCTYSPKTRMETCESEELSHGKALRYFRTNIYQSFNKDLQRGHTLLSPEDVADWNSEGKLNPTNRFTYHRCDCLREGLVETRTAKGINTLSSDETGLRRYWGNLEPSNTDYDIARKLSGVFGTCKPQLS
jgi:hypothetical protein